MVWLCTLTIVAASLNWPFMFSISGLPLSGRCVVVDALISQCLLQPLIPQLARFVQHFVSPRQCSVIAAEMDVPGLNVIKKLDNATNQTFNSIVMDLNAECTNCVHGTIELDFFCLV